MLLVIPFWVSYLLRMLAWIGLLDSDGYVNKILTGIGIAHPPDWLNGNAYSVILALVYGSSRYLHRCAGSTASTAARSRRPATSARRRSARSCT